MDLLTEILLLWALENPDYQYQQGFNDLVSVLYTCMLTDTVFCIENEFVTGPDWDLYLNIHNPYRIQAEVYFLFDSIMRLSQKYLYSKTIKQN